MNDNTRHLSSIAGHSACLCGMCWSTPGARRFAKRRVRRAVRHSERAQINDEVKAETDFDGDVTWSIYQRGLTLDNARNLRSVDWDY